MTVNISGNNGGTQPPGSGLSSTHSADRHRPMGTLEVLYQPARACRADHAVYNRPACLRPALNLWYIKRLRCNVMAQD